MPNKRQSSPDLLLAATTRTPPSRGPRHQAHRKSVPRWQGYPRPRHKKAQGLIAIHALRKCVVPFNPQPRIRCELGPGK